jgi:hypothetical protein
VSLTKVTKWPTKHQLVATFEGEEGSWKTSTALTAPGPVGFFNFDRGLDRARKPKRKDLYVGHYPFRKHKATQDEAKAQWDTVEDDIHRSIDENATTVLDTADLVYEMVRMAIFGRLEKVKSREYGEVNRAMNDLYDHALDSGHHFISIHPIREIYVNDKGSGKYGPKGWSDTVYRVNQRFFFGYEDQALVEVLKPRNVEEVIGNPDFISLAMSVFPDADEEEFA